MTGQRSITVLVTVLAIFLSTTKSALATGFHLGFNSFSIKTPEHYRKDSSDFWIKTQSNSKFEYQITENSSDEKILELKSLKSGNKYTLYKSSLVKEFSQLDVSPDGKSIVFSVKINQDDGFIDEVHILNFNKETGFILSDGIVHSNNDNNQLTEINFDQTKIILGFKDNSGNKSQKTIDRSNTYHLNLTFNDYKGALRYFYGGSLPKGSEVKLESKNNDNQLIQISFSKTNTAGEIAYHELNYDAGKNYISEVKELDQNLTLVRDIKFSYQNNNSLAEIYNKQGQICYRKAFAGKPMADIISDYLYLSSEVTAFYHNSLAKETRIFIDQGEVEINPGLASSLPIQTLKFASSFNPYAEYGFYLLEEFNQDGSYKDFFVFNGTKNKAGKIFKAESIMVKPFNISISSKPSDLSFGI